MNTRRLCCLVAVLFISFTARAAANPTINTQPGNASIVVGQSTSFTVAATASAGSLTYQWQGSLDGGTTWSNIDSSGNISNSTTATMSVATPSYFLNGAQLRCAVTDSNGTTTSNTATLSLTSPAPLLILAGPAGKSAFQGDASASFTAVVTGTSVTYQWQLSTDGGNTWANVPAAAPYSGWATATLSIADPYTNFSGYSNASPYKYRCNVTSGTYTVHTKGAGLNVYPTPASTPTVTTLVNGSAASSIASNDSGPITVQVAGIPAGGTIRVERYADLNGNGMIDPGEPLVQSFTVTDGSAATFGGVADPAIPGDTDGTADGTVKADFYLQNLSEFGQASGAYIFKVISPGGSFRAVNSAVFTVTQPALGQTISGTVKSGGNAVPYAQVAVLNNNSNGSNFVSAVVADQNGNFSIEASPGSYNVLPLAAGYVSSFANAGTANVTTGADVAVGTLTLTPAAYMQQVQVTDQSTGNPLRGVQLFFQSNASGYVALADTDNSGVALAGALPAADWSYDASSQSIVGLGYVRPQNNGNDNNGNTLQSTNSSLGLQAANALIYGQLKDNAATPNPIAGVDVSANDQNNNFSADMNTDASGNYYLPVYGDGESWNVGVDSNNVTPAFSAAYALPSGVSLTVNAGSAQSVNFVAPLVTAHLSGIVTNADNGTNPVSGVQIDLFNNAIQNGNSFVTSVTTGDDGSFSFGVVAGSWSIALDTGSGNNNPTNLVGPNLTFANVVNGDSRYLSIAYQVHNSTGTISGQVTDSSSNGNGNANVYAYATIGGVTYNTGANTDNNGNYSFPIIAGSWTVGVNSNNGQNYNTQTVTVTGGTNTVNFAPPVYTSFIQGTVTNNGTPVAGANVGANLQNGNESFQVTTDSNGNYSIGVDPGTWNVSVNTNSVVVTTRDTVTVGTNQTLNGVNLSVLSTTGTITGQVTGQGGNPVSNATVYGSATVNSVTYYTGAQTDGNGDYSMPVVNGSWNVGVNASNGLNYPNQTVTVTGSAAVNLAPLVYTSFLQGTVKNNGTPVAGLMIFAFQPSGGSFSAKTDSNGNFSIGVPAGSWNISLNNQTTYVGGSVSETITDNETISGILFPVLTATGTLGGQVLDASGNPVSNVNVSASVLIGGVTYNVGTQTDSGGNYSFAVVNGSWTVVVNSSSGLNYANQTVNVTGATATANFAATVISLQPVSKSSYVGLGASFDVQLNEGVSATFQWQVSTDGGSTWTNVPGTAGNYNTFSISPLSLAMNGYQYRCILSGTFGSETSASATLSVASATIYQMTDIGVLPGGYTDSNGTAINASGQVAGYSDFLVNSTPTFQFHAFLYTNGVMTDLGVLPNYSLNSYGLALNASGAVVGYSYGGGVDVVQHAFVYEDGAMTDVNSLATLPGGFSLATATAINDSGQILTQGGAGLITGNTFTNLPQFSYTSALNNAGQAVGEISVTGPAPNFTISTHAGIYSGSTTTDLGALPTIGEGGVGYSWVSGLNSSGQAVGWSETGDVGAQHAVLFSGGTVTDLGTLDDFPFSYAAAINDAGVIVGNSNGSAFVYRNGTMLDLNTLVLNANGMTLTAASGINNNGWITGTASTTDEHTHAFILTPVVPGAAPYFVQQPSSQTTGQGQSVTLTASAASYPQSTYQWQKNGQNIAVTTATLTLANVQPGDAGTYTVIATNSGGSTPSSPAVLSVNQISQFITFSPLPNVAFTTAPLALSAAASSGLAITYTVLTKNATVNGNLLTLTGTGAVTVEASQAGDATYAPAVSYSNTFNVTADLASWQQTFFTGTELANPAISGPNAVYGQDGLPNLVKYALGLNPTVNATSGLPATTQSGGNWVFTYTRPTAITDVTYAVEVSTDLITWTQVTPTLQSSAGGMDTWTATYPVSSATKAFFHLKVTQ